MPTVTVSLPAALTAPEPAVELSCVAETVGDALLAVVAQAPHYEQRIFFGRRLLVTVAVNGSHLPPGGLRERPLADGDRVELVAPVAGG